MLCVIKKKKKKQTSLASLIPSSESSLMASRKQKRKSLSEQISDYTDPTPRDHVDPESLTSFNDNTSAKYDKDDHDDDEDIAQSMSSNGRLLLQAEPDVLNDPRYAGVKVSRKKLKSKRNGRNSDSSSSSGSESDSDSDSDGQSSSASSSDSDSEKEDPFAAFDNHSDSEEDELDRRLSTFSNTSLATPQESAEAQAKTAKRSQHTLHQKKLWTDLLGIRVRLQPLLELGNRLPNSEAHGLFHDHSDENLEAFASAVDSLTGLLRTCVSVSETLSRQHQDVKALPQTRKRKRQADAVEDLWDEMDTSRENFIPYRDAVVSRWSNKTQLQSGVSLNKKFKVVNRGILSQIGSVLADETRLLKRTRTRRTDHTIVGESLRKNTGKNNDDTTDEEMPRSSYDDVDEEIFDDGDFFKVHRQEYLESTMSGDDFMALSKSYASRRTKKKKKVDTKASKGRRLKYVVMPKLTNFCAPEHVSAPSIDVDTLMGSLFGGK